MRKQISTLCAVGVGLIALTLPAAAQAEGPSWFAGAEMLGESPEESAAAVIASELTMEVEGIGLKFGPCNFVGVAELWNNSTVGEGLLQGTALSKKPCPTQFAGCKVEIDSETLPWRIAATPAVDVVIENVRLTITPEKNPTCEAVGLGKPVLFLGDLVGPYNNATSCIEYKEAGELEVGAFGITVNGASCFFNPVKEAEKFTLK